jgi:DNA-directed RNA polymerase subunit RPC12/RpoP
MEQRVVTCPDCGHGSAPGQSLCMNCGSDLPAPPAPVPVRPLDYRCPNCGTPHPPQIVKRLSSIGWLVLVLGILFFLVGTLFALFFMEERRVCPICGTRIFLRA